MEEIRLVGSFDDNISPKLRKLNKSLKDLERQFRKFGVSLGRFEKKAKQVNKELTKLSRTSSKLFTGQSQKLRRSADSWDTYTRSVKRASRAARNFRPPNPGRAPRFARNPAPRFGRGMAPGVGPAGTNRGGFSVMRGAGAAFIGGAGLLVASEALQGATRALGMMATSAIDFQRNVLDLESTLNIVGGMDMREAEVSAERAMDSLTAIATALPGDTADYLAIFSQTLDEQILGLFGSAEGALKNLELGDQSFAALFGLATTGEGLNASISARDLSQLMMNPERIDQVTFLKQNATLKKLYMENLEAGMKPLEALYTALKKAYPQSRINKMRKSLSSQFESLRALFFDPKKGIFGSFRKVTTIFGETAFVDELGKLMKKFTDFVKKLSDTGFDPLELLIVTMRGFGSMIEDIGDIFSGIDRETMDRVMHSLSGLITEMFSLVGDLFGAVVILFDTVEDMIKATGLVGEGFNILEALIFGLKAPFALLRLMLLGFSEALLQFKYNVGLASEDDQKHLTTIREQRQSATARFEIEAMRSWRGMSWEDIEKVLVERVQNAPQDYIAYDLWGKETVVPNPDRTATLVALDVFREMQSEWQRRQAPTQQKTDPKPTTTAPTTTAPATPTNVQSQVTEPVRRAIETAEPPTVTVQVPQTTASPVTKAIPEALGPKLVALNEKIAHTSAVIDALYGKVSEDLISQVRASSNDIQATIIDHKTATTQAIEALRLSADKTAAAMEPPEIPDATPAINDLTKATTEATRLVIAGMTKSTETNKAALNDLKAQVAASSNNIQSGITGISSQLSSPLQVELISSLTIPVKLLGGIELNTPPVTLSVTPAPTPKPDRPPTTFAEKRGMSLDEIMASPPPMTQITTGSMEQKGGLILNGGINVTINGANKTTSEMAEDVAEEIMNELYRSSYTSLYNS